MEFKVGDKVRVIKNRNSVYGCCKDIMKIEGEIVTILEIKDYSSIYFSDSFRILDGVGEDHFLEAVNVEFVESPIRVGDKVVVLKQRNTRFGSCRDIIDCEGCVVIITRITTFNYDIPTYYFSDKYGESAMERHNFVKIGE